jgi:hypothetical protein
MHHLPEAIMSPLNTTRIDQIRELRANEMQHLLKRAFAHLADYGRLFGATVVSVLLVISEGLRPLFSWNPRARASQRSRGGSR